MESAEDAEELPIETKAKSIKLSRTRVPTRYVLPSERYALSVHIDVLRRFITLSKNGAEPVPTKKLEGAGIPGQAASTNVRFMRSIGLLSVKERRGHYIPTPEAIKFVSALSVSKERARPILQGLLSDQWFTELVRALFSQRRIMSEDQLVDELAIAAETNRDKKGDALRIIVDYLVYAAILNRDEQGLSLAERVGEPTEIQTQGQLGASELPASVTVGEEWHTLQTEDFVVRVKSDPDVLEELTEHLKLLARKIKRLHEKRSQESGSEAITMNAVQATER